MLTSILACVDELLSVSTDLVLGLCIQLVCLNVVLLAFLGVHCFSLLLNLLCSSSVGYLLLFLLVTECVSKCAALFPAQ